MVRFLSTQANSLLGMCSYTVREARSAAGATPDAFLVGNGLADAAVSAAECATGAFLVIPNSAVQAPEYCGGVLSNTNDDTSASPVTGKDDSDELHFKE